MPPARILLLRPDTYGDLFLFEPVPRILRHAWPESEIAVLIREPYRDVVPIIDTEGLHWLTTACNPYREAPGDHPGHLAALRETVQAFAPDCVVAACSEQTWLEAAVAAFLPETRQIGVGRCVTDPGIRAALEAVLPIDWQAIYPEQIVLEPGLPEWEKNLRLAGSLLGGEAPRWWPAAQVPEEARDDARRVLDEAGLSVGEFCVCAAAGTANVQIKSWPAEHYGETLAWLERDRGVRTLLIGHVSERERLEAVQFAARRHGSDPAVWTGRDGEMPLVAALLDAARFYFGNDTGALHLAAALGRPVVPIFGGGAWPRFRPVAARAVTVVQPLPCFGCGWDCHYADAPCVRTISPASVRRALAQYLDGETTGQAVLEADDLGAEARALIEAATPRLRFLRADSLDRLRQVYELTQQVGSLQTRLETSDEDRSDRQRQVEELTGLLAASESDRKVRLDQAENLTALLAASEADRTSRLEEIERLRPLLAATEADRAARLEQIEQLAARLLASETDRAARLEQIEQLAAQLLASETDRAARLEQIEQLAAQLLASETDRAARLEQIEQLTAQLLASETDRAARLEQIEQLTVWLIASDADRTALSEQLRGLTVPAAGESTDIPHTKKSGDLVMPSQAAQSKPAVPDEHACTLKS